MDSFDTLIIGAGQAGKPLALELARAGRTVALVEREHVGGTCINVGCTPTKTMVASARVAYLARRAADFGVRASAVEMDMAKVVQRKREIVERFRKYGTQTVQRTANLELIYGVARFVSAREVEVALADGGTRRVAAERIVINTGGRPAVPPVPGVNKVPFLDSTSIMEVQEVPRHLVIVGGGYIGLEFAQMFRRFGAAVTVLQRDDRLIPREDADVSQAVHDLLVEDGVRFEFGVAVERFAKAAEGIDVSFTQGGAARTLNASHLLLASGRRPNTEALNLAAAGIAVDTTGYIQVDDTLQTSAAGVYAVGDVKGGPAFTHISYDDYRVLRDRWLHGLDARIGQRLVPNTMFIDPQLGQVGLTETEAKKRGLAVRVAKLPMGSVARALEMSEARGFIKVVVDAQSKQILGATVLGIEGGELMSMLQIAMLGKLPYTVLKEAVFAHPTLAEALNNVFLALDKG